MNNSKIKVSLEEVNSSQVDVELHKQDVANRMAQHQKTVRQNYQYSGEIANTHGSFFRKSIVYMAIFGLLFSILGWFLSEGPMGALDYLLEKLLYMSENERNNIISECKFWITLWDTLWYIIIGTFVSIGIAIAESCVSRNTQMIIKNAIIGGLLGAFGGFLISFFIDKIYTSLGGGSETITLQQIFARAIGWGVLGAFVAIAPGIMLRSSKRFFLGLAGGAIGGFVGGMLFDPICLVFKSVVFARFVNIVALGVGAAIATAFLENIAKQGWLKVASGLIAGKQFILYRNPTVIGSSPKCEIYLFKDPSVAPKHAAINSRNGEFIITSIDNSTVFVNDHAVLQQKLTTGDRIRIGNTIFIFEARVLKNARHTS